MVSENLANFFINNYDFDSYNNGEASVDKIGF